MTQSDETRDKFLAAIAERLSAETIAEAFSAMAAL